MDYHKLMVSINEPQSLNAYVTICLVYKNKTKQRRLSPRRLEIGGEEFTEPIWPQNKMFHGFLLDLPFPRLCLEFPALCHMSLLCLIEALLLGKEHQSRTQTRNW